MTKQVHIRATPEDIARWTAAATADRRSLSAWLRVVADEAARQVLLRAKRAERREAGEADGQG